MDMSRPTKLTPETIKKLCDGIREGLTLKLTCQMANIGSSTYFRWIREAEDPELCTDMHTKLIEDLRVAEAEGAFELVQIVRAAAKSEPRNWPAAMTLLERRHPEGYARANRPAIVDLNVHSTTDPKSLPVDQRRELVHELIESIRAEEEAKTRMLPAISASARVIDEEPDAEDSGTGD